MFGKAATEGNFLVRRKQFNGSDFLASQSQQNELLSRYRSAPTSFLASFTDSTADISSSGDEESESVFTAFMDGHSDLNQMDNSNNQCNQCHMKQEGGVDQDTRPGKHGDGLEQMDPVVIGSFSVGLMECQARSGSENENGLTSGLARRGSSPAGFFSGFGLMGDVGHLGGHSHAKAGPCPGFMHSITEHSQSTANGKEFQTPAFIYESWNDDSHSNNSERNPNDAVTVFDNQNGKAWKDPIGLALPRTSAEMPELECKYLQFQQDTVPYQIRAKRGCATHPRSIAERIRRTRISQKMKKLQDLCPNMDKQANTAEMLDLAVEYIKQLQKQVETLSNTRSKCVCRSNPPGTNAAL